MVFLSLFRLGRTNTGPTEFWRKRKIFKLTAHMVGRRRNCYSVAIKHAHRALAYVTKSKELKRRGMAQFWDDRLTGATREFGCTFPLVREAFCRMDIQINKKCLSDLAIWEPRTFKSLVSLAWVKASEEQLKDVETLGPPPENVYTPKS